MESKGAAAAVLCLVCCVYVGVAQGRDLTLEPNTAGSDVVLAAVAKVLSATKPDGARIFGIELNYWVLRRIAYVETTDGLNASTYNNESYHGGIWRVDEEVFHGIRTSKTNYKDAVESVFGISWNDTFSWTELRKPLYSALATALNLVGKQDCKRSSTGDQTRCWLMEHRRVSQPFPAADECRYQDAVMATLDSGGIITMH